MLAREYPEDHTSTSQIKLHIYQEKLVVSRKCNGLQRNCHTKLIVTLVYKAADCELNPQRYICLTMHGIPSVDMSTKVSFDQALKGDRKYVASMQ